MPTPLKIAIIGAGPAGLTCGLALARRGIDITIVERGANHLETATYNPNRSYTIDITGHGKKATLLWRPYRACKCFTAQTQGDALGFHMAPRWGWEGVIRPRRLPVGAEQASGAGPR